MAAGQQYKDPHIRSRLRECPLARGWGSRHCPGPWCERGRRKGRHGRVVGLMGVGKCCRERSSLVRSLCGRGGHKGCPRMVRMPRWVRGGWQAALPEARPRHRGRGGGRGRSRWASSSPNRPRVKANTSVHGARRACPGGQRDDRYTQLRHSMEGPWRISFPSTRQHRADMPQSWSNPRTREHPGHRFLSAI